ncbi:MAG: hypothetical protein J0M17_17850 [Planctomycetes bacterium]|nr:hypothetical protein [Planctomycetota bacterium]
MSDKKVRIGGHSYWRHKTTGLWWSRDTARHGGSAFKVYVETASGRLDFYRDADEYGDFIFNKHKGPIGKVVVYDATNEEDIDDQNSD